MTHKKPLRTKWSNPEKYYTKTIGISANRIRNIFLFLTINLFCRNTIGLRLALNGNAPNQIEKRGFRLWFVVFRFAHASARLAIKSRFHKVAAINIRNKKKEIIGIFLASLEVFRRIGEVFNLYVSQLTNPH